MHFDVMTLARCISRLGTGLLSVTAMVSTGFACEILPHGVEFCSENTEFRLIQESPDKKGLVYGLPSESEHNVLGMVFVYDGPEAVTSQEELFLSLNSVIDDRATIHLQDQLQVSGHAFDRIVWENTTRTGPEVAARSLFWDGEFFILAFTTEQGIELTDGHLGLHQLFVSNLRVPKSGS